MSNILTRKYIQAVVLAGVFFLVSCTQNSLTGKRQLTMIPEAELQSLASSQYNDFFKTHAVVKR